MFQQERKRYDRGAPRRFAVGAESAVRRRSSNLIRLVPAKRAEFVWGAVAALGGLATARVLVAILGDPARAVGFDRLTTSVSHSQMPLWLISGAGSAVFVLGVILRAAPLLERWLRPLADAGNLALTIYVAHLLLLAVIVRPEPHVLSEGLLITAAMVVGAVVLATLWRIWFSRGPLEALLRGSWADRGAIPQRRLKSMDPRPSG